MQPPARTDMETMEVRNMHGGNPVMTRAFTNPTSGASVRVEHFVHYQTVFTGAR